MKRRREGVPKHYRFSRISSPMPESDWCLQNQARYLTGVTLVRRRWTQTRDNWDHDHCEFCMAKFMASEVPDVLHEGWTTPDEYWWICDTCFNDFHERFGWT